MEQFRDFSQVRTNTLTVLRYGFFRQWYELTDGQFIYGKISTIYQLFKRQKNVLESAKGSWVISAAGLFSRTLLINTDEDQNIGVIKPDAWGRKTTITLNDGSMFVLTTKNLFSKTFTLANDQYGEILTIEQKLWSFKKPFVISIDQNLLKSIPLIPQLALLGVNLILLRQAQAAAATT